MTDHAPAKSPDNAPSTLENSAQDNAADQNGTAVASRPRTTPAPPKVDQLPPWNVMLHNDPVNEMSYVVATVMELTALDKRIAMMRMLEAHTRGVAMLLTTHRERAELIAEQFASKRLIVTIEPA